MAELSGPVTAPLAQPQKPSPAYRAALAAVIFLGVLIVVALGLLVAGLAMRFGGGLHRSVLPAPALFTLAPGTRVISLDVSGERLVLRLRGAAGDEIDVIDTATGRLVAKVRSAGTPPAKK